MAHVLRGPTMKKSTAPPSMPSRSLSLLLLSGAMALATVAVCCNVRAKDAPIGAPLAVLAGTLVMPGMLFGAGVTVKD